MKECKHDFKYLREETDKGGDQIIEQCAKCLKERKLPKTIGLTVPKNVGFLDLKLKF